MLKASNKSVHTVSITGLRCLNLRPAWTDDTQTVVSYVIKQNHYFPKRKCQEPVYTDIWLSTAKVTTPH